MLRRFKGGAVVACDVRGCPHTFRSFSRAALVRGQATADGWTHRKATKLDQDALRAGLPIAYDRCPTHGVEKDAAPEVAPTSSVAPTPVAPVIPIVVAAEPAVVVPRKRRARRDASTAAVPPERKGRLRMAMPGTLVLVAEILRAAHAALSVREIVELAGGRLPSKSKTPATVVSRDLALAIKSGGDASIFVRTAPGRFMLREFSVAGAEVAA